MKSDIPELAGLYHIRNIVDGKVYVGSAVNLKHRWFKHRVLLRSKKHHSTHLQHAWDKYGEQAFVFEVLETCDKECLLNKEQNLLDSTASFDDTKGYNMAPKAYSQLGRKHSEETKQRISAAMKRREFTASHRKALSEAKRTSLKAKAQSMDSIAKASAACVGRIESEETRRKKSIAHLGKRRKIV